MAMGGDEQIKPKQTDTVVERSASLVKKEASVASPSVPARTDELTGYRPLEEMEAEGTTRPKRFYSLPDLVGNTPGTVEWNSDLVESKVVTDTSGEVKQGLPLPRGEASYDGSLPASLSAIGDWLKDIRGADLKPVGTDGQGRIRPEPDQVLDVRLTSDVGYWGVVTPVKAGAAVLEVEVYRKPRCSSCFFNPTLIFVAVDESGVTVVSAFQSALSEWFPRTRWNDAFIKGSFDVPESATDLIILAEGGSLFDEAASSSPDIVVEWK